MSFQGFEDGFGWHLYDVDISQIADNNGGLPVTVSTQLGDLHLTDSLLERAQDAATVPTPTPGRGTLLLMGSGLVGISVAMGRRKGGGGSL